MTAPKVTAEEAHEPAYAMVPKTVTDALALLGYTLIPTDPASVEDMVERGGLAPLGKAQNHSRDLPQPKLTTFIAWRNANEKLKPTPFSPPQYRS